MRIVFFLLIAFLCINMCFYTHGNVQSAGRGSHSTHTYTGHRITVLADSILHEADKGFLDVCVSVGSKAVDAGRVFYDRNNSEGIFFFFFLYFHEEVRHSGTGNIVTVTLSITSASHLEM